MVQIHFHFNSLGGDELGELRRKQAESEVLSGRGNDLWISDFAFGGCPLLSYVKE